MKSQQQKYGGCTVEYSLNTKAIKLPPLGQKLQQQQHKSNNNNRRGGAKQHDRREGTIESSEHYKQWLESVAKQKEELNARPKPIPGGGMLLSTAVVAPAPSGAGTTTSGSTTTITGDGIMNQPVAFC